MLLTRSALLHMCKYFINTCACTYHVCYVANGQPKKKKLWCVNIDNKDIFTILETSICSVKQEV